MSGLPLIKKLKTLFYFKCKETCSIKKAPDFIGGLFIYSADGVIGATSCFLLKKPLLNRARVL